MNIPIYIQRCIFTTIFTISLLINAAQAQYSDIQFERIGMNQGLSNNSVTSILMDNYGFMWFGTFDGLNRYDGYKIKVYRNIRTKEGSISTNRISSLYKDSQGRLWVGTRGGGLNLYDFEKDNFKVYSTIKGKKNQHRPLSDEIRNITEDKEGNIWLATNKGVNVFNPETETFRSFVNNKIDNNSLNSNDVYAIHTGKNGSIYIGTDKAELNIYNPKKQNFKHIKFGTINAPVLDILEDSKSNIWVALEFDGLFKLDIKTKEKKHYKHNPSNPLSLAKNAVRDIYEDENGAIWLATDGGGLNILRPNSSNFINYKNDISNLNSFSNDAAYSIYKDKYGHYWIGTARGGINLYKPDKRQFGHKKHHARQNSLIYDNVLSIECDNNNNIWLGTDGGGLDKYIPNRNLYVHYTAAPNNGKTINGNAITSLLVSNDNTLYIGCYGKGLNIYNPNTESFKYYNHKPGDSLSISDNNIRAMVEDKNGNIWIGTEFNGLNLYNPQTKKFKHFTHDPNNSGSISSDNIADLAINKNGEIWIATQGGGLNLLDTKKNIFKSFKHRENDTSSISGNYIRTLHIDRKNRLWIGTEEAGLNLYNGENQTFKTYREKQGLPNNTILAIQEDDKGNLWLSTNNGMSCFSPKTNNFRNFDATDGLQGNQFMYNSSTKDKNGQFYFGGLNGFNVFHPDQIKENTFKPQIYINKFKIFNTEIGVDDEINDRTILEKNIILTNKIELTRKENVFSIEFVGIEYFSPDKNHYEYKLEGFDKTWIKTDAQHRTASYTNLNPGEYTFLIKASNSDGIVFSDTAKLKIIVIPPFWQTWWFYSLLGVIAIALIITYIQYKERKLGASRKKLEGMINERTKELMMQKDEMQKQKEEIMRRMKIDEIQNWQNKGLAYFGDIMSKGNDDIKTLSQTIIKELVKFLEAGQGALCLINENNPENVTLDMVASYALDNEHYQKKSFELNEGLIGACYTDQKTMYITDLPDDYLKIQSGLGASKPNAIVLVPLTLENICFGIIEIASFKKMSSHKIDFIKKLATNITSTLYVVKMNTETSILLKQSQKQAKLLKQQDEVMKQNLEEIQTTQDDFARREIELLKENQSLQEQIEKLKNNSFTDKKYGDEDE